MLAEQGKLADLVEPNLSVPKRPLPAPKVAKNVKKENNNKKRRGRSKVKKRR